jgi:hypothetical protein
MSESEESRGPIEPGDPEAEGWGFTPELFVEGSYLWRTGSEVMVSFVAARSPGSGALSKLRAGLKKAGLRMAVPTPLAQMEEILKRWGFKKEVRRSKEMRCDVEVWTEPTPALSGKERA